MYLIRDIRNTEIKICVFNNNLKLIKNIKIHKKNLNKKFINKKLKRLELFKEIKLLYEKNLHSFGV